MRTADALRQAEIGKRIRTIRLQKKIRQVDLAANAGMSWRHLIRMEQGQGGEPKPETLGRIAAGLGVERSELTGEDDDEEESEPMTQADLITALRPLARLLARAEQA